MRHSRKATARAVIAASVLLATSLATAPAAQPRAKVRPRHCGQLKGQDLLPHAPAIKLVRVPYLATGRNSDNRRVRYHRARYLVCALPNGLVRRIASVGDYDGYSDSLGLRGSNGTFFIFTVGGGTTMGSYDATWTVFDAKTGRHRVFASYDDSDFNTPLPPPDALHVDPAGRVVALYARDPVDDSEPEVPPYAGIPKDAASVLRAYGTSGHATQLDAGGSDPASAITAASVSLTGTTVSWRHGTEPRTFDLATLPAR